MLFVHPAHPGRRLRLAYCLNLHAAETLAETVEGIRGVTLPLRDRLSDGRPFGVGVWLPASVALALAAPEGADDLEELGRLFAAERLDAFTFNAFPYGGFHRAGLKADVYRPTWAEPERAAYTLAVAHCAARLARGVPGGVERARDAHVSISTHPGAFGAWVEGLPYLAACARNLGACVAELARLEAAGGPRVVLSLEAEPRASAGDSRELAEYFAFARPMVERVLRDEHGRTAGAASQLARRHLGTCLDCCHSAVEFEDAERALALATHDGPLGKLQFSSAVALTHPGERPDARAALLAMDEPVYLHQVTGRATLSRRAADDLPALARELAEHSGPWLACDEWRCHFHVPVDREELSGTGLTTTRAHADALLALCLADPGTWTTPELHVEIETYTWDVLPGAARGPGELVDGLEAEYAHVLGRLADAGWSAGA